jgi:hypothetical protein
VRTRPPDIIFKNDISQRSQRQKSESEKAARRASPPQALFPRLLLEFRDILFKGVKFSHEDVEIEVHRDTGFALAIVEVCRGEFIF